jgi:hypothetical protein
LNGLGFDFGKEGSHLIARAAIQSTLREVATLRMRKAPNLSLYRGDRGQADAEFVHPETDENRHGLWITSNASADAGKSLVCARRQLSAR